MKRRHLIPLLIATASIAACSSTTEGGKSKIDYQSDTPAPKRTLEVPPDLTAPDLTNNFALPSGGVTARGLASQQQSQQSQQSAIAAGTAQVAASPSANLKIERAGTQRWLVVSGKSAEQLWPQVREFWQDNGFVLKRDEPQVGIMETDWAENRAKIPQDGLRNLLSKVGLDGLYSTPERDRFRTRFERHGSDVEIYISHRGMVESFTEGKNDTKWQSRPDDPELEAEFLSRLMVTLGADEKKAKDAVEQAAQPKSQQAAGSRARVDGDSVVVDDGFDRASRRTGLALDRTGLIVTDRDRTAGTYFVRPAKSDADSKGDDDSGFWSSLAFWRDKPDTRSKVSQEFSYRVVVKQVSDNESRVSLLDPNGQPVDGKVRDAALQKLATQLR